MNQVLQTFYAGEAAFYDAHTHILPCRVLEVIKPGNGRVVTSGRLKIELTKTVGPYKKGETMEVSGYHTFPKTHSSWKESGQMRINPLYRWE